MPNIVTNSNRQDAQHQNQICKPCQEKPGGAGSFVKCLDAQESRNQQRQSISKNVNEAPWGYLGKRMHSADRKERPEGLV
ncbi:hypothetical protein AGMMS50289_19030 [Betaproteobacteria bacterium]|nr:hypothetical protein AGMMS50289_19030 [Betaproteobacteria bacterium]